MLIFPCLPDPPASLDSRRNRHTDLYLGTFLPSDLRSARRLWRYGQGTLHQSRNTLWASPVDLWAEPCKVPHFADTGEGGLTPCRWNSGWFYNCTCTDIQCFENAINDHFRSSRKQWIGSLICFQMYSKSWFYWHNVWWTIILCFWGFWNHKDFVDSTTEFLRILKS